MCTFLKSRRRRKLVKKRCRSSSQDKRNITVKLFRVTGFEPTTSCSQNRCATGLRYTLVFFLETYFFCVSIFILQVQQARRQKTEIQTEKKKKKKKKIIVYWIFFPSFISSFYRSSSFCRSCNERKNERQNENMNDNISLEK